MWKFKIYKLENVGFQDSYKRKGKKKKKKALRNDCTYSPR